MVVTFINVVSKIGYGEIIRIGITSEYMDKRLYGIGLYTKHLIRNLLSYPDINLSLIHYKKNQDSLYNSANDIVLPLPLIPPRKFFANLLKLPKVIKALDLIHVTAPNPSDNLTIFKNNGIKKILTIHDVAPLKFPPVTKLLFQDSRSWFYQKAWSMSLIKAVNNINMVIADSENTKEDIINLLRVPEEKIRVILLAPAEIFQPISNARNSYIQRPFILSEDVDPIILEAYYRLKKKGINEKLVVFGAVNERKKQLKTAIKKYSLEKDVLFTGYVPDEELVGLFNTARLFIFIHAYEGFGLTPLEAIACGCPVVASNVASIPEVVGDAGLLVNPYSSDEQADAIYELLTNDGLRKELIKKGLERAKIFSWKRTARETYNVYKEVLDGRTIH